MLKSEKKWLLISWRDFHDVAIIQLTSFQYQIPDGVKTAYISFDPGVPSLC